MKIFFKKPKKKKILILDRQSCFFIKHFLKKNIFGILDVRYESINIYVLFYTFFYVLFNFKLYNQLKNLKHLYIINYISLVSPRTIISTIDNNFFFYRIKKFFPSLKVIIIQNGIREDSFFRKLSEYKKKFQLHVDYFFAFNGAFSKKYKKNIKGNFIAIGNVRNNNFIFKKKKYKHILFISQSRTNLLSRIKIKKNIFYYPEFFIFNILKKISKKNKIKLVLLSKQKKNKIFYNYFKFDNIVFSNDKKYKEKNRYKIINDSILVVFLSSTFGYEAFSRGIKVVCLPFYSKKKRLETQIQYLSFGYPYKIPLKGPFWTNSLLKNAIEKKINLILKMKNSTWLKIYEKYKFLMPFDSGNVKIRKIINKTLK